MKLMKFVTSFAVGGTERQFVRLALGLDASRFEVHFGCLRRFGHLLEPVQERGIPVVDYEISSFLSRRALTAQFRLARDIRRNNVDIVHTYNFYANVFAIPAAKLGGARIVASIRDMGAYLSPRQRAMQRHVCRLADRILVNAAAIRDWLVEDGYRAEKITVIPNGIETPDLDRSPAPSIRRELGIADDAP
ncbi:MAG TPA: glycosyltransferase, partial [Thermoanaerobaculia bacterium]|nr:glycosyltransferase [Thermoanaerobaculia bacterium]